MEELLIALGIFCLIVILLVLPDKKIKNPAKPNFVIKVESYDQPNRLRELQKDLDELRGRYPFKRYKDITLKAQFTERFEQSLKDLVEVSETNPNSLALKIKIKQCKQLLQEFKNSRSVTLNINHKKQEEE